MESKLITVKDFSTMYLKSEYYQIDIWCDSQLENSKKNSRFIDS